MKICKNYEIFPTSWNYAKILKFCQLQENVLRLWNFANFMKLSKNNKILPTSWKYAKIMKFCKLHETMQKLRKLLTSRKYAIHANDIFPTSWNNAKIMKFCQLHEATCAKIMIPANIAKICKNYEILPF